MPYLSPFPLDPVIFGLVEIPFEFFGLSFFLPFAFFLLGVFFLLFFPHALDGCLFNININLPQFFFDFLFELEVLFLEEVFDGVELLGFVHFRSE